MSKKKVPITERRWVEDGGSIYTADEEETITEWSKQRIMVRAAIAFNVGQDVARHIVKLHNESIK